MGVKKGMINNPIGRPTGSKNKVTVDLRKRINDFLNDNWETLEADFKQLEPKERLGFYEKLLQYGLPKMSHTQLTGNLHPTKKDINSIFPNIEDL